MKKKDRVNYKREKVRELYVYHSKNSRSIADALNNDPEFVRICGKTNHNTIYAIIKKIDAELENMITGDAIDTATADYMKTRIQFDKEIEEIDGALEDDSLKMEVRIKLMSLRHQVIKDRAAHIADKEIAIAVKKIKLDRKKNLSTLKMIKEEEELPKVEFKVNEKIKKRFATEEDEDD